MEPLQYPQLRCESGKNDALVRLRLAGCAFRAPRQEPRWRRFSTAVRVGFRGEYKACTERWRHCQQIKRSATEKYRASTRALPAAIAAFRKEKQPTRPNCEPSTNRRPL